MKEIKPLTALRGVFAVWVLCFHLGVWAQIAGSDQIIIISRGYLAVDFFFLLSGFILASAHGAPFINGLSLRKYGLFIAKRAGRLFPLHLTVLAVSIIFSVARNANQYWWSYIVSEAALAHRWGIGYAPKAAINGPDWSISTEWAANILFPIFVWVTFKTSNIFTITIGSLSTGLLIYAASCHNWSLDISMANSFLPLIRCFSEFTMGMLIYRCRNRLYLLQSDRMFLLIAAAGLILLVLPRSDLAVVFIMAALLHALSGNIGRVKQLMSVTPLHYLGEISYSLYLVQIPVLLIIRKYSFQIEDVPLRLFVYILGTIAWVIVTAAITYRWIESPARDWSKSTAKRLFSQVSKSQIGTS